MPDQTNSVHVLLVYYLNVHFNIILPSMATSSQSSLSFRFYHQQLVCISRRACTCYMSRVSNFHNFVFLITFVEGCNLWSSSLCNFLESAVSSSLLGPNIFLSTLFPNTFSLRSMSKEWNQVSHPYKTTNKITVLCIFIFTFWHSKRKDKSISPPKEVTQSDTLTLLYSKFETGKVTSVN